MAPVVLGIYPAHYNVIMHGYAQSLATCVLVVVSVLYSAEYPREGGLSDAVFSQKHDLVDLSV